MDRLDLALSRVVETGRTAAQGRIRRQAPEIIRDLVVSVTAVYIHSSNLFKWSFATKECRRLLIPKYACSKFDVAMV